MISKKKRWAVDSYTSAFYLFTLLNPFFSLHQELELRQREKAVSEKLQKEEAWYDQQKRKLRDKGSDEQYPQIKKQRGVIRKLRLEQVIKAGYGQLAKFPTRPNFLPTRPISYQFAQSQLAQISYQLAQICNQLFYCLTYAFVSSQCTRKHNINPSPPKYRLSYLSFQLVICIFCW